MRCLPLTTYDPGSWHLSSSRYWGTSWTKRITTKRTTSRHRQHGSNQWRRGRVVTKWSRASWRPQSPAVETTKGKRSQQCLDTWTGSWDTPVHSQPTGTGTFHITIQYLLDPKGHTALLCERTHSYHICDVVSHKEKQLLLPMHGDQMALFVLVCINNFIACDQMWKQH